jgi:hypothetical protein
VSDALGASPDESDLLNEKKIATTANHDTAKAPQKARMRYAPLGPDESLIALSVDAKGKLSYVAGSTRLPNLTSLQCATSHTCTTRYLSYKTKRRLLIQKSGAF